MKSINKTSSEINNNSFRKAAFKFDKNVKLEPKSKIMGINSLTQKNSPIKSIKHGIRSMINKKNEVKSNIDEIFTKVSSKVALNKNIYTQKNENKYTDIEDIDTENDKLILNKEISILSIKSQKSLRTNKSHKSQSLNKSISTKIDLEISSSPIILKSNSFVSTFRFKTFDLDSDLTEIEKNVRKSSFFVQISDNRRSINKGSMFQNKTKNLSKKPSIFNNKITVYKYHELFSKAEISPDKKKIKLENKQIIVGNKKFSVFSKGIFNRIQSDINQKYIKKNVNSVVNCEEMVFDDDKILKTKYKRNSVSNSLNSSLINNDANDFNLVKNDINIEKSEYSSFNKNPINDNNNDSIKLEYIDQQKTLTNNGELNQDYISLENDILISNVNNTENINNENFGGTNNDDSLIEFEMSMSKSDSENEKNESNIDKDIINNLDPKINSIKLKTPQISKTGKVNLINKNKVLPIDNKNDIKLNKDAKGIKNQINNNTTLNPHLNQNKVKEKVNVSNTSTKFEAVNKIGSNMNNNNVNTKKNISKNTTNKLESNINNNSEIKEKELKETKDTKEVKSDKTQLKGLTNTAIKQHQKDKEKENIKKGKIPK